MIARSLRCMGHRGLCNIHFDQIFSAELQCFHAHSLSSQALLFQQSLERAISPGVCQALQRNGYAVVDGLFGDAYAGQLRAEIKTLRDANMLHPNCTHLVLNGTTQLLEKHSILEAELLSQEIQKAAPLLAELQQDSTLRTMLSLFLPAMRLGSQAIKLQYNSGAGGCFPMHADSDEGVDSRRLTAIVYLNPRWSAWSGGELRLYPYPHPPVSIEPLNDRLVIFPACHMVHRVLPSWEERFCFTTWMSESRRLGPQPRTLAQILGEAVRTGTSPEAAFAALLRPSVRKHVAKVVLAGEWAESIEQSHPQSKAREAALQTHWREIAVLKAALDPVAKLAGVTLDDFAVHAAKCTLSWI